MGIFAEHIGTRLARFLSKPRRHYESFSIADEATLRATLQPGDLLLVEGNSRISTAIQYLTQSTWSHVCLYIGDTVSVATPLLEADLVHGVICVPLSKYTSLNTRICRPIGLRAEDRAQLLQYAVDRIGFRYDLKNIFDLLRYLLPTPPVPQRFRRHMIALGSGDPTRAICSTLIAQAFHAIRYPILPRHVCEEGEIMCAMDEDWLRARHYTHYTPRDFDLSPYFAVIKPALDSDFDYRQLQWLELPAYGTLTPEQAHPDRALP